jgi:ElaB/YqjD/DUF883 family membrane-anchored ribosome-binding protein
MGETPERRWTDKWNDEDWSRCGLEVLYERVRRIELAMATYQETARERMEMLNHLREEVLRERAEMVRREWVESRAAATDARFHSIERMLWMGVGVISAVGAVVQILLWVFVGR